MSHAVCFHLHCYQPPRDDPWLGIVEPEWSAFPYHDWNQRITAECYRPNTTAAILTDDEYLSAASDNFEAASYDIGPTLHAWLARHAPDVDIAVRAAARTAGGQPTGAALAAPIIHAILPLASDADREVLVAWGIADFTARFGFAPEGMWLPETGADLDTLVVLARHGIRFTVLMPQQARRVRPPGGVWRDVPDETIDPTRPYRVRLPGGASITVVFGHAALSRGVAFDGLLRDGATLAAAVRGARPDRRAESLVAVVTDGETFGHHHRFGEMALAWAVRRLHDEGATVTNLGAWLRAHPPTWEVELVSPSSWSCTHGVERWRADCGCTTGSEPGWNQEWRAPLRDALDWLRDTLRVAYDTATRPLLGDPQVALADYGAVLAGVEAPDIFVARHAGRPCTHAETVTVLELLEMQRHMLSSFTSCAWFFADAAQLETLISLRHAAVAIDAAARVLGLDTTEEFLARLDRMHSNIDPELTGRVMWERSVTARRADPAAIAAAWAMESAGTGSVSSMRRGAWTVTAPAPGVEPAVDHLAVRVTVEHAPTRRRAEVDVEAHLAGSVGVVARARGAGENAWRTIRFADADADVVARVALARLTGRRDASALEAIRRMITDLRARAAEVDDIYALRALIAAAAPSLADDATTVRSALAVLRDAAVSDTVRAELGVLAPLADVTEVEWPDAGAPGADQ